MAGRRQLESRWRVYVNGTFACVVIAPSETAARAAALAAMEVRKVRAE